MSETTGEFVQKGDSRGQTLIYILATDYKSYCIFYECHKDKKC